MAESVKPVDAGEPLVDKQYASQPVPDLVILFPSIV